MPVDFETKLINTLRDLRKAIEPRDAAPPPVVVGSSVPSILEIAAEEADKSLLFPTEDVDIAVRSVSQAEKIRALPEWRQSPENPAVLEPVNPDTHLELNIVGVDPDVPIGVSKVMGESHVAFGSLGLIRAETVRLSGETYEIASPESLAVEKLVSLRGGLKSGRDMTVAALCLREIAADPGLRMPAFQEQLARLDPEWRQEASANLALLILEARQGRLMSIGPPVEAIDLAVRCLNREKTGEGPER
ncbi:MAG: hypothetical protein HY039_00975 [Nitrospirae bacterium]|nr:hypothetical protein [Nitrospirota bacterium]